MILLLRLSLKLDLVRGITCKATGVAHLYLEVVGHWAFARTILEVGECLPASVHMSVSGEAGGGIRIALTILGTRVSCSPF